MRCESSPASNFDYHALLVAILVPLVCRSHLKTSDTVSQSHPCVNRIHTSTDFPATLLFDRIIHTIFTGFRVLSGSEQPNSGHHLAIEQPADNEAPTVCNHVGQRQIPSQPMVRSLTNSIADIDVVCLVDRSPEVKQFL